MILNFNIAVENNLLLARFDLTRLNNFGPGDSFGSYYPISSFYHGSIEDIAVNRKNNLYSIVYKERKPWINISPASFTYHLFLWTSRLDHWSAHLCMWIWELAVTILVPQNLKVWKNAEERELLKIDDSRDMS